MDGPNPRQAVTATKLTDPKTPASVFLTAERAVNSFQLDETLLASIANITGDMTFRTWTPVKFGNWLGMSGDVGRDLYWHIIVNEYAHTRLEWLRDARCGVGD